MKLIERIALKLSLLGVPVGSLSPYNFITDVSSSFVKAEELRRNNIFIEQQYMNLDQFKLAAKNHIGFDLVSEILDTEVRDGINIHDHAILLIRHTLSKADEFPSHYENVITKISADIRKAQEKFGS